MIVAEIGQNHCGDMELAKTLIGLAKVCGADLVKFQLYNHKAIYKNNGHVPNVELSYEQAELLFAYGKQIGMEVFFSVFDIERIKWCEKMGVSRYKVGYGRRDDTELLDAIKDTNKPIIVSSDRFQGIDTLYCVPEYPAEEVDFTNLHTFNGFSDHTIGLEAAKVAIDMGADIIEKHFASRHDLGVDAPWSMTPKELKELVRYAK